MPQIRPSGWSALGARMELLTEIAANLGLIAFSVLVASLMGFLAYWMLRPEAV